MDTMMSNAYVEGLRSMRYTFKSDGRRPLNLSQLEEFR